MQCSNSIARPASSMSAAPGSERTTQAIVTRDRSALRRSDRVCISEAEANLNSQIVAAMASRLLALQILNSPSSLSSVELRSRRMQADGMRPFADGRECRLLSCLLLRQSSRVSAGLNFLISSSSLFPESHSLMLLTYFLRIQRIRAIRKYADTYSCFSSGQR